MITRLIRPVPDIYTVNPKFIQASSDGNLYIVHSYELQILKLHLTESPGYLTEHASDEKHVLEWIHMHNYYVWKQFLSISTKNMPRQSDVQMFMVNLFFFFKNYFLSLSAYTWTCKLVSILSFHRTFLKTWPSCLWNLVEKNCPTLIFLLNTVYSSNFLYQYKHINICIY